MLDRLREEFETSVAAALATLQRVQDTTSLDVSDLRGLTAQELENFARQMKATVEVARFGSVPAPAAALIEKELAELDDHLRLALRQFDVGLLNAPQPPALGVSAQASAGKVDPPPSPQSDPSRWTPGSNFDDAARIATTRRNLGAAVESTAGTVLPPLPLVNSNAVITPQPETVELAATTRVVSSSGVGIGPTAETRTPADQAPPAGPAAQTLIGAAVLQNGASIILSAASMLLRIDEKLAQLEAMPPNSEDAKLIHDQAIARYET